MPRHLATAAATAVLGLALCGVASAPAFAATAPVVGSQKCTDAVAGASDVVAAQGKLDKANQTLQGDKNQLAIDKKAVPFKQATVDVDNVAINDDTIAVAAAQKTLDKATKQATAALCKPADTATGNTSTSGAVTTDPTPAPVTLPATETEAQIDAAVDSLSCSSTNADVLRIDRAIAARQVADQTTREVNDRLRAKIDGLNCSTGAASRAAAAQTAKACGCVDVTPAPVTETTVTEAPETSTVVTSKTVVATQDDGSVAKTSGTEVTDVPAGSASTGAV